MDFLSLVQVEQSQTMISFNEKKVDPTVTSVVLLVHSHNQQVIMVNRSMLWDL